MYSEELKAYIEPAAAKVDFMKKSPLRYFLAAVFAGLLAGLGATFTYIVGSILHETVFYKIVMGLSFGGTLCVIYFSSSELFTGNNMLMACGVFDKKVKIIDALKLWVLCFLGNWVGSLIMVVIFVSAGLLDYYSPGLSELIGQTAAVKMNLPFLQLFLRGIFCNFMVCLSTWCSVKFKNEVAKIIIVFWCLYLFLVSGYEHSIANMSVVAYSLVNPIDSTISISGYLYNLFGATLGNIVGGVWLGAIVYFINKGKND